MSLQRSIDPQFKAEMAAAIAEAKTNLLYQRSASTAEHKGMTPPRGYGHQDGEELVVRGSRGWRVQVARARLHQWTPRVEARFLALLEQTCNLRLALKEVGYSAASLHEHRKRWPAFDEACEDALARGYDDVDLGLTYSALRLLSPEGYPEIEGAVVAPMDVDRAIRLVRLQERRRWEAERGVGPGGGVWRWKNAG